MRKTFLVIVTLLALPLLLNAQEVDLLWQGSGYTHPFYEGRTPWSRQAEVIIQAIPQISIGGTLLDPRNLTYKWWRNSAVLGTVGGVGKDSILISDSITGRPQEIKVEVIASDGAILATASKSFSAIPTEILIYENSPLYGILFHKEAGVNYNTENQEITLVAIPFLFNIFERDPGFIDFTWTTSSGITQGSGSVTYRSPEKAFGSARIGVEVSSEDWFLQSAKKSFLLNFKE